MMTRKPLEIQEKLELDGSYQDGASVAAHYAPDPRSWRRQKLGKGTSATRAKKANGKTAPRTRGLLVPNTFPAR